MKLALESPPLLAAMLASACVMAVAAALTTTKAQCHGVEYFLEFHEILIVWTPKAPLMLSLGKPSSPCSHACFMYLSCVMAVAAALTTTIAQCHSVE